MQHLGAEPRTAHAESPAIAKCREDSACLGKLSIVVSFDANARSLSASAAGDAADRPCAMCYRIATDGILPAIATPADLERMPDFTYPVR